MTAERKSSGKFQSNRGSQHCKESALTCLESSHRMSVKRGAKLISKSSKATSNTVVTPPKAAVAAPNAKNDEVHRRRNPFNDMLRHRNMGTVDDARRDGPSAPHQEPLNAAPPPQSSENGMDVRMVQRVAELERALAIAKEEQESFKEELSKLRNQRSEDQVTIEALRHQIDETNQSAPKSPSRPSSGYWKDSDEDEDEDSMRRQNHELCFKLAQQQQEQSVAEDTHHNDLERPNAREEMEYLRVRLHAAEKESQERLQQLLSLKSSISSLTRMDSQVTDGELIESFSQLANRVREWTISNFRRSKLGLSNITPEANYNLRSILPDYKNLRASDRLAFSQAVVADALMAVFQDVIIIGMRPAGLLADIKRFANQIQNPGFSEFSEWRRATIRLLESSSEQQAEMRQIKETLLHTIARAVQHSLQALTSITMTTDAYDVLLSIVSTAMELQLTFSLQKARYEVVFFSNHDTRVDFDDRTMEAINVLEGTVDEDSDMHIDRTFRFCVFPGLIKSGDEWGQHPEISNVLLKARVCTGAG
jgi:hypothetical protein